MANVPQMTVFLSSCLHPLYPSTNVNLAFIAGLLVLNVFLCFPEHRCRNFPSRLTHLEFFYGSGKTLGFQLHSCVYVREGKLRPDAPSPLTMATVDLRRMLGPVKFLKFFPLLLQICYGATTETMRV